MALAGSALLGLSGCSALVSTTNTTADALHTVTHGVSVSSRSTTNVTSGDSESASAAQTRAYVASQRGALQREAAFGGGEHIQTLAVLVGDARPDALGGWMQSHYDQLFDRQTTTDQLIAAVKQRTS